MCVGVPMQIVETAFGSALCNHNGIKKQVDTMLVGEQPPGTWVLVFIDAAREVIPPEEAVKINDALKALEIVMNGGGDFDHLFADLIKAEEPVQPVTTNPAQPVTIDKDEESQ